MGTPLKGRCNAKLPGIDELCDEYPINGSQRCHRHGAYNTGPRTAAGKARSSMNGIKNALYVNALAGYMSQLGIPSDLWQEIPDSVDLTPEIKLLRANILRYSAMLARGVKFIQSSEDGTVLEMRERDDGLAEGRTEHKSSPTVLSVDQLLANSVDQLRRMTKTQHEIKPGSEVGGNFHFKVTVSSGAAKAAEDEARVPQLTAEDPDTVAELPVVQIEDDVKPKRSPGGYDDDD